MLVIIGLLLGGILKGQEMIIQAKVKNSISDFSGVSAAYYGYQDRYRATPGDDSGAGRWSGATPGNGDRVLRSVGWHNGHAATARIRAVVGPPAPLGLCHGRHGTANPNNSFNGILGVEQGDGAGGAGPVLGGFTNLLLCSTNLPDKVAIALDVQMDDGRAGLRRGSRPAGDQAALATSDGGHTSYAGNRHQRIHTLPPVLSRPRARKCQPAGRPRNNEKARRGGLFRISPD